MWSVKGLRSAKLIVSQSISPQISQIDTDHCHSDRSGGISSSQISQIDTDHCHSDHSGGISSPQISQIDAEHCHSGRCGGISSPQISQIDADHCHSDHSGGISHKTQIVMIPSWQSGVLSQNFRGTPSDASHV